jgi:hypothetical protein
MDPITRGITCEEVKEKSPLNCAKVKDKAKCEGISDDFKIGVRCELDPSTKKCKVVKEVKNYRCKYSEQYQGQKGYKVISQCGQCSKLQECSWFQCGALVTDPHKNVDTGVEGCKGTPTQLIKQCTLK